MRQLPSSSRIGMRQTASEQELLRGLGEMPEVGLGTTGPGVLLTYVAGIQATCSSWGGPGLADPTPLLRARPDLRTLPVRSGSAAQLNLKSAVNLDAHSRTLRIYLNTTASTDGSPRSDTSVSLLREAMLAGREGQRPPWLRPEAVPTLLQMLTPEGPAVRKLLVNLLDQIPHASATIALAQPQVFDLDSGVRQAAVAALRSRPAEEYRPVLLEAASLPVGARRRPRGGRACDTGK